MTGKSVVEIVLCALMPAADIMQSSCQGCRPRPYGEGAPQGCASAGQGIIGAGCLAYCGLKDYGPLVRPRPHGRGRLCKAVRTTIQM
eukprot:scaffold285612_cov19-Prasinocladus_malaysianus.AAC.2